VQSPENSKPEKNRYDIIDNLGEMIYGIRWGLIPMYMGLWVAILAYNVHYFMELFHFLVQWDSSGIYFKTNNSTDYLLWILGLIDITMIGNLVVMTTVGGYSTFVKEFELTKIAGKPRWMNGLDSSTLKIKMGMSLVGVSGIHLLKTFMEPHATWDEIWKEALIHVIFMFTTLAFTINARLLHGKHHHVHEHTQPH
jgi:uncharacterized protein (TIGR00645 family)